MKFYLRLEGVNLNNFVYDTQDLHTIRGGGLLLLNAVKEEIEPLELQHKWSVELKSISTGASSGLLEFEAADENAAIGIRDTVDKHLRTHEKLRHASFVVDMYPAGKDTDFVVDRESLLARNRWRQMQQPTLAIPSFNTNSNIRRACEKDRLRPATQEITGPEGSEVVSDSVLVRLTYGQKQKQKFYQTRANIPDHWRFAHDLGELTSDPSRGNLHHKMAILYFDGNGFGGLQNKHCQTSALQQTFDTTLQRYRNEVLQALLDEIARNEAEWKSNGYIRLETLLWGGDELIWVVPAWFGWEVMTLFYEKSQSWKMPKKSKRSKSRPPLTHAGGIVFCHHNAPIHRITALAKDLADIVKARNQRDKENNTKHKDDRWENSFAYLVLESFDHVGKDLGMFLSKRYSNASDEEKKDPFHVVLPGNGQKMLEVKQAFAKLKREESLPKRKLYQIAQAVQNDLSKAVPLIKEVSKEPPGELKTLRQYFQSGDSDWLHIVELWDYIGA